MTAKNYTYDRRGRKVKVMIPSREMTPADYGMAAARNENELHDEENPAYLFSGVWTTLLVQIANGEVDANYVARVELANRGLDKKGVWVGFAKAKRIHGIL